MKDDEQRNVWVVYDGDCPLCQSSARVMRIRRDVGRLILVDARTQKNHPVIEEAEATGLNIDLGMIVKYGDRLYHGADALNVLAMLSSPTGWLNKLVASVFSVRLVALIVYPALRAMRNFLLWIRGKSPLTTHGSR